MKRVGWGVGGAMVIGAGLLAAGAQAEPKSEKWTKTVPMRTTVHEHAFHKLQVRGAGCKAVFSLHFEAPAEGYATNNDSANFYRFKARIELSDGAEIVTRRFVNRTAGRRKYTAAVDTTSAGCWSKTSHAIQRVEVVGCRGKNCQVPKL